MKEKSNKKIGINLYIILFFIIYGLLQLGFTGLYTYTTVGSLFTCLMYFSIYVLFGLIYTFFKFRKKELSKEQIKSVQDRIFIATAVIIVLATIVQLYTYFNNMYGTQKLKGEYNLYTQIIGNNDNEVQENVVDVETSETIKAVQSMIEYDAYSKELDNIYNEMKDKIGLFVLFRVITDIINILISAGVVYIIESKLIDKICKRENENINSGENIVDGESK